MTDSDNQIQYPRLLEKLGITSLKMALFLKENSIELRHHWRKDDMSLKPVTWHWYTLEDGVNEIATTERMTKARIE